MKKLKSKVFITIFLILTISIITILLIFNVQNYTLEKNKVINNLNRMINDIPDKKLKDDKDNFKDNIESYENRKFMDLNVYTVLLDDNYNIKDIINHGDIINLNAIRKKATDIIKSNKKVYIGNLYLTKYSYKYEDSSIIIIDNTNTNKLLITSLKNTILLFILLELVVIIISYYLTKYLTKPVIDSFNRQKTFIADASHELKTPLAVIMASADAIEEESKWVNNIKSESERMNKLIKDLLDLAKLENKSNKIYELVDLSRLVEMSVLTYESLIYEKNIKLEYDIDQDINFKCDKDEIKQLLGILIDNAIKHSIKNGTIKVCLNSKKDDIYITVLNEGSTIPKGEEDKIFERFYRVDKSRNRNDNRYGLGLAIAKSITEKYSGKISAKSIDNKTKFTVVLKK